MRGLVYGDIIGSPFHIENSSGRYFEAGRSRSVPHDGRIVTFHPQATEASITAAATARWLCTGDSPTAEGFMRCMRDAFDENPRAIWSESTRALLTARDPSPIPGEDPYVLVRSVPIAMWADSDEKAEALTELCCRSTHSDSRTVAAAIDATRTLRRTAGGGRIPDPEFSSSEDLKNALRGLERIPLEMMGTPVEGAFTWKEPDTRRPLSPSVVMDAAIYSVSRSDSWEDAVRTAVSLGGPSALVAAMAGALAEIRHGEPRMESGLGEVMSLVPKEVHSRTEHLLGVISRRDVPEKDEQARITGSIVTSAQRERARGAFAELVGAVRDIQSELKETCGLDGQGGQLKFQNAAYPYYDPEVQSVSVFVAGLEAERITLSPDGMLRTGTGETRTASVNARTDTESLGESLQAARSILSRPMLSDPAGRIGQVIAAIRATVLDEHTSLPDPGNDFPQTSNRDALERDIAMGQYDISGRTPVFRLRTGAGRKENTVTRTIYTIGFSNRSMDEYRTLLKTLGVDTVIDIRSIQTSRSRPHFDSVELDNALYAMGVDYLDGSASMGERQDRFLGQDGRVDWEAMRKDEGYRRSIGSIADLMEKGHTIAVCCSEGSPLACHRLATVARDLDEMGANVMHAMRNGELLGQREAEDMLVSRYASKGLVDTGRMYSEQVRQAFREMNMEKGWKPEMKVRASRSRMHR